MGSKTPVSILQELLVRRGSPPQYDLIYDGGGTHEALFKYRVHAGTVTAIGSGRSKKQAKHEAARSALERLSKDEAESEQLEVPEDALDFASPYQDKIQENAVGALLDLCATNGVPLPEYDLLVEEGPPHARQFTYCCSVSKHREIGVGRTKKQAKQLASSKMLARLRSLPNIVDISLDKKVDDEPDNGNDQKEIIAKKYLDVTEQVKHHVPMGKPLSDYHLSLTYLSTEDVDNIMVRRIECNKNLQAGDAPVDQYDDSVDYTLFEELMETLEISHSFDEVQCGSSGSLVLLRMKTSPESVLFGRGTNMTVAMRKAASNALQYFNIMCRKMTVL